MASGYASETYALSQAAGPDELCRLRGADTHLLRRRVPGGDAHDAAAVYPLLQCGDWSELCADLAALEDVVAVVAVPDPLQAPSDVLDEAFPDHRQPFNTHHLRHLDGDWTRSISKHHRYYARRALSAVAVEVVEPTGFAEEFSRLYGHLVETHDVAEARRFDVDSLRAQLAAPGMVMFRAVRDGEIVAAHCWVVVGDVATSHLAASSAAGYEVNAAYALHWTAFEHLAPIVTIANLGGNAGSGDMADGLSRFKAGWADATVTAEVRGRILDRERYEQLTVAAGTTGTTWFPAYRAPA